MGCIYHGYGKKPDACAIQARCKDTTSKPEDTTCPYDGDGTQCEFVKAMLCESHDA